MCLKHVHFGSSLSGALFVNLWLSFDYRFDYLSFSASESHKASHIIFLGLSLLGGGHIVFHAFLRCQRHLGSLLTKFNSITRILTVAHILCRPRNLCSSCLPAVALVFCRNSCQCCLRSPFEILQDPSRFSLSQEPPKHIWLFDMKEATEVDSHLQGDRL